MGRGATRLTSIGPVCWLTRIAARGWAPHAPGG
jgi:hypothetical protein